MKQELNEPWQPEQDGFEFSLDALTLWMHRRQLQKDANRFEYYGDLSEMTDSGS